MGQRSAILALFEGLETKLEIGKRFTTEMRNSDHCRRSTLGRNVCYSTKMSLPLSSRRKTNGASPVK